MHRIHASARPAGGLRRAAALASWILLAQVPAPAQDAPRPEPLQVCCTVPSLGSIVAQVGGGRVAVTTFAKGTENAHYLDARPSHVKALAGADLVVVQGLDLEIGWLPVLLQQCRNGDVQPGRPGYLDVSQVVAPLEVPAVAVDRSHGDVHASGNPHYLTDPLNGLAVARLVRDRLGELAPDGAADFARGCAAFERDVCTALVGERLAADFPTDTIVKLAQLHESGGLAAFLHAQGRDGQLGGWLGALAPYAGTKVIADHNQWVYFGERFGLEFAGFLEPKPGISPSTSHLAELIRDAPGAGVRLVFTAPGFDPRSSRFVAEKIGVPLVVLAHEVGATPEASGYVAMLDFDVRTVAALLAKGAG